MSVTKDLQKIMIEAHRQAASCQASLEKSFFPRLARYAGALLAESVNIKDIQYATDKVIEGGHSPYLLRSFVEGRLGSRGGSKQPDAYDQAVSDFPDYSSGR